jgi:glucose-6-phosphate 1-dehydrogenase
MVIFGAAGDLTKRKLIPALYNVAKGNLLSREFAVIGVARADLNDDAFRAKLRADIAQYATGEVDPAVWEWIERHLHYVRGIPDAQTYEKCSAA